MEDCGSSSRVDACDGLNDFVDVCATGDNGSQLGAVPGDQEGENIVSLLSRFREDSVTIEGASISSDLEEKRPGLLDRKGSISYRFLSSDSRK